MRLMKITINNAAKTVSQYFCHMLNWRSKRGQDYYKPYIFVNIEAEKLNYRIRNSTRYL
jgi:hypothetical protein